MIRHSLAPCDCTKFCGDDARVWLGSVRPCDGLRAFRLQRALECSRKRIADRAVVCDIESFGVAVHLGGVRWYDTRPMLDLREAGPECVDMASEAIAYALAEQLATQHAEQPWLLRITAGGEAVR